MNRTQNQNDNHSPWCIRFTTPLSLTGFRSFLGLLFVIVMMASVLTLFQAIFEFQEFSVRTLSFRSFDSKQGKTTTTGSTTSTTMSVYNGTETLARTTTSKLKTFNPTEIEPSSSMMDSDNGNNNNNNISNNISNYSHRGSTEGNIGAIYNHTFSEKAVDPISAKETRASMLVSPFLLDVRSRDNSQRRQQQPPQPFPNSYERTSNTFLPRDFTRGLQHWNDIKVETCLTSSSSWWKTTDTINKKMEPHDSWKLRTPYFVVLGHHKSGTQAFNHYLWDHPLIVNTDRLESFFFSSKEPFKFVDQNGIQQSKGQDAYLAALMKEIPDLSPPYKSPHSKYIRHESSPRYFLDADRVPYLLLCLAPWVKLIVLLRNPVERVESHYNYNHASRQRNAMHRKKRQSMVPWRAWIEDDMRALRQAGVIGNNDHNNDHTNQNNETSVESNDNDFKDGDDHKTTRTTSAVLEEDENLNHTTTFRRLQRQKRQQEPRNSSSSSFLPPLDELTAAWRRYTTTYNSQYLLGRGLYAIQLKQWYAVMDLFGKNRSDLLVIQSEKLKTSTQTVYNQVLDFLDLPPHTLINAGIQYHVTTKKGAITRNINNNNNINSTTTNNNTNHRRDDIIVMPKAIRKELEKFYAPYNQELYKLLGKEWDGVWDPKTAI